MAKVFIGIALVFMLATAGVALVLKGNIDKLQGAYTKAKSDISGAEARAKTAKADADKAQKAATDATAAKEAAEKTAQEKTKEAEEGKTKLAEVQLVVEGKDKEIAALNEKVKGAPNGPTAEDLAKKDATIAELTTQKQNAERERDEQKTLFEAEKSKGTANEQKVADLTKEKRKWETNFTRPGIQGRILAVNSGWNFVVLSVGDKQGVVMGATLLVVRGNEPVARLRVTSVEPSTSIADVLPGSVRRGTSIQPGDTVIFEGSRNQAPAAPGKTAPDTTAAPVPPVNNTPLPPP
jgi:hypothetical protein